jgi:hypothetical protein
MSAIHPKRSSERAAGIRLPASACRCGRLQLQWGYPSNRGWSLLPSLCCHAGVGADLVHPDPRLHIVALCDRHRRRAPAPALRKVSTVFPSAVVEMGNVLVRLRRDAGAENEQGNGQYDHRAVGIIIPPSGTQRQRGINTPWQRHDGMAGAQRSSRQGRILFQHSLPPTRASKSHRRCGSRLSGSHGFRCRGSPCVRSNT